MSADDYRFQTDRIRALSDFLDRMLLRLWPAVDPADDWKPDSDSKLSAESILAADAAILAAFDGVRRIVDLDAEEEDDDDDSDGLAEDSLAHATAHSAHPSCPPPIGSTSS